jgi:CRP/FNR family cyclic AMP-dependent transcriptional regulator
MGTLDLNTLPLFDGLTTEEVEKCTGLFQQREFVAGSILVSEGDFSYKFFVILEGEVDVHRDFELVAQLGPGEFFGEAGIVAGDKRNARVTPTTRSVLAWVMGWEFKTMMEEFPAIVERVEETVAARSPDS